MRSIRISTTCVSIPCRFLCLFLITLLTHEAIGGQCACATGNVHVRTGADTSHNILGTLAIGECHPDKGGRTNAEGFEWANVDYNGHNAWVADKWLHFQTCASHSSGTHSTGGCPHIISRAEWGARAPRHAAGHLAAGEPHYVFIHHGASGGCHTKDQCIAKVRAYQNYHMDGHGWSDIGYSFVVGEDGNVYEARGWDKVGAHTLHYNSNGIAICVIGNFEDHVPNDAALNAIKSLIACGVKIGKVPSTYVLKGHRDVGQTACPGQKLYDLIQSWPHYRSGHQ